MVKKTKIQKLEKESKIIASQIKAIAIRDIKLNVREARFIGLFLFVQLLIPCGFYFTQMFTGRIGAYYSVIILNAAMSRVVITNNVEEKAKKFRSTFKLMGLRDVSYSVGTFIANIATVSIGLFTGFIGNAIFNSDYTLSKELFHYELMSLVTSASIIAMNMNLSLIIKNPKIAADVSAIYVFTITYIPLALANNADGWFQVFCFIPQISYIYDMNHTAANGSPTLWYMFFSLILLVFYLVLYWWLEQILPNENGLRKKFFFCLQKNEKNKKRKKKEKINLGILDGMRRTDVIKVKKLVKQFGRFSAVDDISFDISSNKVTCILGHNGAGKSTLINMMCGILKATSGEILFKGKNIYSHPEVIDGMIGYCAAFDVLYDKFSVYEYLEFVAVLKTIKDPHEHIMELLNRFGLNSVKNSKISSLSGGERRRVSVLMAVVGEPPLLFLDEPSSGIDPQNRRFMWKIIEDLKSPERAVILTTHHLEEAEILAEDVIVMSRGKILVQGTSGSIKNQYGIGYEFSFSKIGKIKFEKLKILVEENFENLKIDENEFESGNSVQLVIPISQLGQTTKFVKNLENENITFGLKSNSLEEAFIKMGEKEHKASSKELKITENLIEEISKKKYKKSLKSIIWVLFLRRFMLLIKTPIQIFILLVTISYPAFTIHYSMDNIWESISYEGIYKEIASTTFLGVVSLLCSVFVFLPGYERNNKMRYILKKIGVSSFLYYIVLFISDLIIGLTMSFLCFVLIAIVLNSSHNIEMGTDLWILTLSNLIWISTYIAQSYMISFLFKSIVGSARLAPFIILATIIGFPVPFMANNSFFIWLTFLIFPLPCFVWIQANSVSHELEKMNLGFDFSINMTYLEGHLILLFSTVLYLTVAIYLDNSHFSAMKKKPHRKAFKRDHKIIEPSSVENERKECIDPSEKYFIQCGSIEKTFKQNSSPLFAIKRMDVALRKNEILGVIGPNGAGKTTLFNLIGSYHQRNSGEIFLSGKEIENNNQEFFDEVGLCLQEDIFWDDLTVNTHLKFICMMKGIDYSVIDTWLAAVGLENFKNYQAFQLSSGMKRKLCFIMAMIFNPLVKMLDEPSTGLDPIAQKTLKSLIKGQMRANGGSTMFTTQTMTEAESLCDRIAIMVNGGLCCITETEELKKVVGGYHLIVNKKKMLKGDIFCDGGKKDIGSKGSDEENMELINNQKKIGKRKNLLGEKLRKKSSFYEELSNEGNNFFSEKSVLKSENIDIEEKLKNDKLKSEATSFVKGENFKKENYFEFEKEEKSSKNYFFGKNDSQKILDILSQKCKLELISDHEDSMKFNILKFEKLSEVFELCENLTKGGMIDGFWVSEMNLEDIFLLCTKDQAEEVKKLGVEKIA